MVNVPNSHLFLLLIFPLFLAFVSFIFSGRSVIFLWWSDLSGWERTRKTRHRTCVYMSLFVFSLFLLLLLLLKISETKALQLKVDHVFICDREWVPQRCSESWKKLCKCRESVSVQMVPSHWAGLDPERKETEVRILKHWCSFFCTLRCLAKKTDIMWCNRVSPRCDKEYGKMLNDVFTLHDTKTDIEMATSSQLHQRQGLGPVWAPSYNSMQAIIITLDKWKHVV